MSPRSGATARRALEERIRDLASAQHGVVSRTQLVELGVPAGAIRSRLESGVFRSIHRGVYQVGPITAPYAREMAALLACGDRAVISHGSAAVLHGLILPSSSSPVDVTVALPGDRTRPDLRVHRVRCLPDIDVMRTHGLRLTTPGRTIADIARSISRDRLERIVAHAERERLISRAKLAEIAERRGMAGLRAVLEQTGGPRLTRSHAEERFLALIRRAGLPTPESNARVGEFEVDFLWRDHRLAVEVDGYRFHSSRPRFEADRRRATRIAALGIQIVPVTWRQIVDDEVATAVQLGQALVRAQPPGPL